MRALLQNFWHTKSGGVRLVRGVAGMFLVFGTTAASSGLPTTANGWTALICGTIGSFLVGLVSQQNGNGNDETPA